MRSDILVNPFTVEYVSPGIIHERSSDGLLSIFILDNGNPKTVDAWLEYAAVAILNWPAQQPCLLLHDFRKAESDGFDHRLLDRLQELLKLRPDLQYRIALVMTDDLLRTMRCEVDPKSGYGFLANYHVFIERKLALVWLLC